MVVGTGGEHKGGCSEDGVVLFFVEVGCDVSAGVEGCSFEVRGYPRECAVQIADCRLRKFLDCTIKLANIEYLVRRVVNIVSVLAHGRHTMGCVHCQGAMPVALTEGSARSESEPSIVPLSQSL